MAIWDNFGKKASETTAKAMQKAKDMAEISRLNSLISEEEHKINDIYNQIGRRYVSLHITDDEAAFSELLTALQQTEHQVQVLQRQVQDIKGVQRCVKCGAEIPQGSAFCSSCGAPVTAGAPIVTQPPVGFLRCPHCGDLVKMDMRFCTSCGTPLQQEATKEVFEPEPPVGPLCPSCGAQLEVGVLFCTECGTRLQPEEQAISEPEPVPAPESAPEPEPPVGSVCPSCGAQLEEGVLFCTECGIRLQPEEQAISEPEPVPTPESVPEPELPVGSVCPSCGVQLEERVLFCTECGAHLQDEAYQPVLELTPDSEPEPEPEPESPMGPVCPSCGAQLEEGVLFCTECGTRLQPEEQTISEPEPVPAPESAPEPEPPVGSVCPSCGAQLEEGVLFCTECGARLQPEVQAAPEPALELEPKPEPDPVQVPPAELACPYCGVKLRRKAVFCMECGARLPAPLQPESKREKKLFCPICGAKLDSDAVFCSECGTKLEEYQNI